MRPASKVSIKPGQLHKTNMNSTILTNGQSVRVLIGAMVELKMSDKDGTTGHEWIIPGNVVSNFVTTNYVSNGTNVSLGYAVLDVPRQTNTVAFAWWKTGNHLVEAKCKLMGKDLTAKFRFIVEEPGIPVWVNPALQSPPTANPPNVPYVYGQVGVSTANPYSGGAVALHFGLANVTNFGIAFLRGTGGYGEYQWWQVVNSSSITMVTNGVTTNTTTSGVDGDIPYSAIAKASDGPLVVLKAGASSYTVKDSFSMYLMYRPTGGIWAPFRQFNWGWEGTATNGTAGWGLATNSVTTPAGAFSATNYPGWNRKADKSLLP